MESVFYEFENENTMNIEFICGLLANYSKELSEAGTYREKGDVQLKHAKLILDKVKNCSTPDISGSLRFSEREVDFSYLCGVFNTSGIDGLHAEIQRLKELGKEPHDIIEACLK